MSVCFVFYSPSAQTACQSANSDLSTQNSPSGQNYDQSNEVKQQSAYLSQRTNWLMLKVHPMTPIFSHTLRMFPLSGSKQWHCPEHLRHWRACGD